MADGTEHTDDIQLPGTSRKTLKLLKKHLGDPLPEPEVRMWAAMSNEQRARSLQRLATIVTWNLGLAPRDAQIAAWNAGLKSTSRFYEMASAWDRQPSLAVLGASATAPSTRKNRFETVLADLAKTVVAAAPKESVRSLSLKLAEASPLGKDTPSHNTLRRFVEEEKRKLERAPRPGEEVTFDCCACSMSRLDGSGLTLFAVLDSKTHLILGAALGDATRSRKGYALAAADARARITGGQLAELAWEEPARYELVVGLDAESWNGLREEARAAGVVRPLEPSTRAKRFGRYMRPAAGPRIGRIALTPSKTVLPETDVRPADPTPDDVVRLRLEIDAYNAERVGALERDPEGAPPPDLMLLLDHLAAA